MSVAVAELLLYPSYLGDGPESPSRFHVPVTVLCRSSELLLLPGDFLAGCVSPTVTFLPAVGCHSPSSPSLRANNKIEDQTKSDTSVKLFLLYHAYSFQQARFRKNDPPYDHCFCCSLARLLTGAEERP